MEEDCVHYIDGTSVDRACVGRVTTYRPLMSKQRRPNMAERGIVCFVDEVDSFDVYMPSNGDIKTVAKTLESVRLPAGAFKSALQAGDIAAEFLKQHRTKYPHTRLIWTIYQYRLDSDLVYRVNVRNITVTVQKVSSGRVSTKPVFSGTVEEFYKWADANHDLHKAVDKIVKFVYKGGSGTRERVVKLTSVTGNGSGTLLKGWDVHKSTGDKPAYRSYRVGNIVGKVEVIG